jgi:hypothetical protein
VAPFSTALVEVGVIRVMSSRMSCFREADVGTVIGRDSG